MGKWRQHLFYGAAVTAFCLPATVFSTSWDGRLVKIDQFVQRVPSDGEAVSQRTEAYLGYDDKNLYAIFICFDNQPHHIRARLSRREDVFDDDTVGFVVKMSIPFRSLRFASNDPLTWGILLNRNILRNNESSFWPQYSSRVSGRLNQEGDAIGLENISPGHNFQLIPYGIFRSYRDLDLRDLDHPKFAQRDAYGQIGLDAKAVVKDKFVIDATANPDFSQIESDDPQITVNQRFEVEFPEKRPFFLENSNYFQTPIPLLFTRRIVDPQWGVRMTGKDGPWAVGMLVADDASPGAEVAPDNSLFGKHAYFAVGRISRDIGNQSSLGLMFTDREVGPYFNRVGGIDGRFTLDSHWVTSFQGVVSSTLCSDTRDNICDFGTYRAGPAAEVIVQRSGRKLNYILDYADRSDGFRTFTGFNPQPDIHNLYHRLEYSFRPEGKHLISWGPQMEVYHTFDHEGNYLNSGYFPALKFEFVGQTFLNFFYAKEMELLRPKDFSVLTSNQKYTRHTGEVEFKTSLYRPISFALDYRFGTRINYDSPDNVAPFLAGRTSLNTTLTIRPSKSLRVDNTYLLFRLHSLASTGSLNNHIVRSKWNYQYTKKLSFRFIGEYDAVLANPAFTYLETTKNFNVDFLITYLIHPSTAFYFGYNSNLENVLLPLRNDVDGDLLHGGRMRNDGRGLFVKASYLFRF